MTMRVPGGLDPITTELVGIAAAVAGHCEPCFTYHYNEALNLGVPFVAIEEAVNLARSVRQAGQKHMEEFARRRMAKPVKVVAKAANWR
jgi:AhpD family alkylhydroperoxidase